MFDNDIETAINFYFFLKESEYVLVNLLLLLERQIQIPESCF